MLVVTDERNKNKLSLTANLFSPMGGFAYGIFVNE